ncbi:carboxypeptidase-like regulatory domain-containing protein [Thermogutta sp.]|uniref:carboxypeptidase-like regulatory domain-containing protein n=1 Tax=Thermogutta sp. TaxID=1962930 RepID=UPI003C7B6BF5
MAWGSWLRTFLNRGLLAVGITLCLAVTQAWSGEPQSQNPIGNRPRIPDIRLDTKNALQGVLVSPQGTPLPNRSVTLFRPDSPKALVHAKSDRQGRFQIVGITPGSYQLRVEPDSLATVRLWDGRTAPPSARDQLLVVVGNQTVRGQQRIDDLLTIDDKLVVGGMVAAAIAIPIAIANTDKDVTPISP